MKIPSNPCILLTGAGFTHNFGGPLASQLWALIFNHPEVQSNNRVRQELLNNQDFEAVYNEINEGDFQDQEKKAMESAVYSAYSDIDEGLRNFSSQPGAQYPVNIDKVQKILNAFTGTNSEPGFIFTLNQDLFLERHYYNGEKPVLPCISHQSDLFTSLSKEKSLSDGVQYLLPYCEDLSSYKLLIKTKLFYLKLHGSCNWSSSIRKTQMVIGRAKEVQIKQEPLLNFLFKVFQGVLFQPDRRLLIIGYGFGDNHINDIFAEAISNYGLRIYIISPSSPDEFQKSLSEKPKGNQIWDGLAGYFPYKFSEMFPADQSESVGWRNVQQQFFNRTIV